MNDVPERIPGSEKIGYARVSSISQNLDSQIDALKAVECTHIFSDKTGGTAKKRPGWDQLMGYIRSGDTLVVTELSRMTRSLLHALQVVNELEHNWLRVFSSRGREPRTYLTSHNRCRKVDCSSNMPDSPLRTAADKLHEPFPDQFCGQPLAQGLFRGL